MQRIGEFKFLLPFLAAFKKMKKAVRNVIMNLHACTTQSGYKNLKKVLKLSDQNFNPVIVRSLFLIFAQILVWVFL